MTTGAGAASVHLVQLPLFPPPFHRSGQAGTALGEAGAAEVILRRLTGKGMDTDGPNSTWSLPAAAYRSD